MGALNASIRAAGAFAQCHLVFPNGGADAPARAGSLDPLLANEISASATRKAAGIRTFSSVIGASAKRIRGLGAQAKSRVPDRPPAIA